MKYNSQQEVFDAVVKHAEQMIEPSIDAGGCLYRSQNGNKCLVGALIRDSEYSPEMDGDRDTAGACVESLYVRGILPEYLEPFLELLKHCQYAHDRCASSYSKQEWKMSMINRLKGIANIFGLSYNGVL